MFGVHVVEVWCPCCGSVFSTVEAWCSCCGSVLFVVHDVWCSCCGNVFSVVLKCGVHVVEVCFM